MSVYIKLATMEYPRHEGDIRGDHPEISEDLTGDTFPCPATYAKVTVAPIPAHDLDNEYCKPKAPELVNGAWVQGWEVLPITEEMRLAMQQALEQMNKPPFEVDPNTGAIVPPSEPPTPTITVLNP